MQTILTDIVYAIVTLLFVGCLVMMARGANGSFDPWDERYNKNRDHKDYQDS